MVPAGSVPGTVPALQPHLAPAQYGLNYYNYAQIPGSLGQYFLLMLQHAQKDFAVYLDERYNYGEAYAEAAALATALQQADGAARISDLQPSGALELSVAVPDSDRIPGTDGTTFLSACTFRRARRAVNDR